MGNVAQRLSPNKPQGAGVSPSPDAADSANRVPLVEVPVSSRSPSAGNASFKKPVEQPQSSDTSYGVEATAVRKLAATTGTVAILSTTAKKHSKENDPDFAVSTKDLQIVDATIEDSRETLVTVETPEVNEVEAEEENAPEKQPDDWKNSREPAADKIEGEVQRDIGSASSDTGRRVPQITETLVASLEASPVEEFASRSSPDGAEPHSTDVSGIETQITGSTDTGSDDQVGESSGQPKVAKREVPSDEAKSETNESASSKTMDYDISSEQMKTNSLSDISFSDLDDKESGIAVTEQPSDDSDKSEAEQKLVEVTPDSTSESSRPEPATPDEPLGESDKSEAEQKLVEITPDSASESSQQITKEESTSDIITDTQQESKRLGDDEERLISSPSGESSTDIEDDDENKRNNAAIKIQSSFRGFKVRKTRSPKDDDDQLEEQLTLSEIEIIKEQVDGVIKEAEETTESLRNTPDVDEVVNAEDDFPAPPDDALLIQLNDEDQEKETRSLTIETVPYPNVGAEATVKPITVADTNLDSDEKQSPLDNDESTTAELARMTADEDLPAPDFELLESSCTEDLDTEVVTSDNVFEDEPQDSTEGDVTIEEDSDKLKELQKPQECDDLDRQAKPAAEIDAEVAATKIQANVRGFLARKHVEQAQQEDGALTQTTVEISEETKNDSVPVVEACQKDETAGETKSVVVVEDVAESVAKESDQEDSRNGMTKSYTGPTESLLGSSGEPNPPNVVSEDKAVDEKLEQKQSPVPEEIGTANVGGVPSETPEMIEPPEGSIHEPVSTLDEALDKMSSQSDSISQDTISQNTVEELLKQQDHNLPPKPSIEEKKQEEAVSAPQDTIDDRTEGDIIADTLIKTLPESDVGKIAKEPDGGGGKDPPVNIELVSEPPKAITPDMTDNSSHSIEELSSNLDRESLYPSNENSTVDIPDIVSTEETKGSSTASITSDSAKEQTSDVSELTKESDSKASTDFDVEEISESEMKKPDENVEQPKVNFEPKENGSEALKADDTAPPSDVSAPSYIAPVQSEDAKATSNNVTAQSDDTPRMYPVEQSTTDTSSAEIGKDEAEKPDTPVVPEDIAGTQRGSAGEMTKKTEEESEPASLKINQKIGSLPNTPSELDDELLNNSATKIQANVRGYLSRKKQSTNQSGN